MRGEHARSGEGVEGQAGSSPRARGAPAGGRAWAGRAGIIPACAGSTPGRVQEGAPGGDHPRVRGEHCRTRRAAGRPPGSSPRARGAPASLVGVAELVGIIPACAGSTLATSYCIRLHGDHPRVRGEHRDDAPGDVVELGSSPRARGALSRPATASGYTGIIPACAGSTGMTHPATSLSWDHPRVRGEHSRDQLLHPATRGSSPRARGALSGDLDDELGLGIIPACAGSTSTPPVSLRCCGDHPRVRGEH